MTVEQAVLAEARAELERLRVTVTEQAVALHLHQEKHAAHSNFPAWAQLTTHARTALTRTGRFRVDQDLLRWAFSRLA
ncbi:hypothetical protein [Streptomyces sp. NPDC057909]|uniref:hypothetical protein n=1 Tax=Streptomyces sp. NPDC057909 TaxID=3346277 RepID=UPI0036F02B78